MTRSDIAYAVNIISQFVGKPHQHHLTAVHRTLRYVHGTLHQGWLYAANSTLHLHVYMDVDWAGCPETC